MLCYIEGEGLMKKIQENEEKIKIMKKAQIKILLGVDLMNLNMGLIEGIFCDLKEEKLKMI